MSTVATLAFVVVVYLLLLAVMAWLRQGEKASYWRGKYALAVQYIEWMEHGKPPISGLPMADPRLITCDLDSEP